MCRNPKQNYSTQTAQTELKPRKTRIGIYARVSSQEQALHGYSIAAQVSALEDYCKQHDYIIIGRYIDEGISGGKPAAKRPAMASLLRDISADLIDLVLFCKLDRWFRNVTEYFKTQEVLDAHNVSWNAILEDYETETANGRMTVTIMLSVAQNERERTSERIKAVLDYKAAKGEYLGSGAAVPYGFRRSPDKKLEKDPDTENIVADLFKAALSGVSHMAAYKMTKDAHPDFGKSYNGFKRILYAPIYAGLYNNQHDFCPSYITEAQHAALLSTAGRRSPRSDRVYLFVGLLACPECGRILVCRRSTIDSKAYIHYTCSRHLYDGACGFKKCMREERVESALMAYLFKPKAIIIDSIEGAQKAGKRGRTVNQIEAQMRRLAETYTDGLISRDAYKKRLADLTSELDALKKAPKTLSKPPIDLARQLFSGDNETAYSGLSAQEKRRFWMRLLRRVVMDADYHIKSIDFFDD